MTAARPGGPGQHAELACVMMLERVNYILSVGVSLPAQEIADQVSAIIYAAFHAPGTGPPVSPSPDPCGLHAGRGQVVTGMTGRLPG
jgi:hypothetical protein